MRTEIGNFVKFKICADIAIGFCVNKQKNEHPHNKFCSLYTRNSFLIFDYSSQSISILQNINWNRCIHLTSISNYRIDS